MTDTSYWAVLDWDREPARIESEGDLERTPRDVPAKASSPNAIVNICSPTGDTLSVGISGGLGVYEQPLLRRGIKNDRQEVFQRAGERRIGAARRRNAR